MSLLKSPGLFLLLVSHKIASYLFTRKEEQKEIGEVLPPIQNKKVK
jgi:hypothetical protein